MTEIAEVKITKSATVPNRVYIGLGYETLGWVDKNTGGWTSVISLGKTGRIVSKGDKLRRDAILNVVEKWNRDCRTTTIKAAYKGETF